MPRTSNDDIIIISDYVLYYVYDVLYDQSVNVLYCMRIFATYAYGKYRHMIKLHTIRVVVYTYHTSMVIPYAYTFLLIVFFIF